MAPKAIDAAISDRDVITLDLAVMEDRVAEHQAGNQLMTEEFVTIHLQSLETFRSQLTEINKRIFHAAPADIDDHKLLYRNLSSKIFEQISNLHAIRKAFPVSGSTSASSGTSSYVRLPTLEIPTFDGTLMDWPQFRDMFDSIVNRNSKLSKAQKLAHLKASVTGEAARLIKNLNLTDGNYDIAMTQLTDRYQNNRDLLFAVYNRFMGQQPVNTNSSTSIRNLIDVSKECIRSLEVVSICRNDEIDFILLYIIFTKMDGQSKELWEQTLKNSEIPSLDALFEFLEQRARSLSAASGSTKVQGHHHPKLEDKQRRVQVHFTQDHPSCKVCKQPNHPLCKCEVLLGQTVAARRETIKNLQLCFNCLRGGHTSQMNPHFTSSPSIPVSALIVSKVTGNLPLQPCNSEKWIHLKGLTLADPSFGRPGAIDLLLGSDLFWDLLREGKKSGPAGTPQAIDSSIGWLVAGGAQSRSSQVSTPVTTVHINEIVLRFWELEALPERRMLAEEEEMCQQHFYKSVTRDGDGRFHIKLRDPLLLLEGSKPVAMRRFLQLQRRLQRTPQYYSGYKQLIKQYLDLGHMELLTQQEIATPRNPTYYIPHHFVQKEDSSTTKFRVVFDATAKTNTGISLNGIMLVGPILQDNLVDIIMRFRLYPIAFSADIVKMCRQIIVSPSDADLQRILWRADPSDIIEEYRFIHVTYGTAAAPYIAAQVQYTLGEEAKTNFPLGSKIILEEFYFDDVPSAADTVKEVIKILKNEIQRSVPASHWFHVPATTKPADYTSRGITPTELLNRHLWWNGPDLLRDPLLSSSPSTPTSEADTPAVNNERRTSVLIAVAVIQDDLLLNLIKIKSSYRSLLRVTAYVLRFVHNFRKLKISAGPVLADEAAAALAVLVKCTQQQAFSDELSRLQNSQQLSTSSKLLPLNSFADPQGVHRVGGRLRYASIPHEQKHPILLPRYSTFADLILRSTHQENLHAGHHLLLSISQQQFWIVCRRNACRFAVKKCTTCAKMQAETIRQFVGDLPTVPVTPTHAFNKSIVDFAGPSLKSDVPRSKKTFNGYLCLFVFLTARAIHLEFVTSPSSFSMMTYEKMFTLTIQIEAFLNSRLLTAVLADPLDLLPLTPGLILTDRWRLNQLMQQHLWQQLSKEFITRIQQRPYWLQQRTQPKIIIKDERLKPQRSDGEIKRPITEICLLPFVQDDAVTLYSYEAVLQGRRNVCDQHECSLLDFLLLTISDPRTTCFIFH